MRNRLPPEVLMQAWYSAMLSFIVEVEDELEVQRSRNVILLKGPEFDFAGVRALAIVKGRTMETSYTNGDGKLVTWSLEKVETVDLLGTNLEDGREIFHEFTALFPRSEVSFPLDPDAFEPGTSGV
jgi:hypothetical protein